VAAIITAITALRRSRDALSCSKRAIIKIVPRTAPFSFNARSRGTRTSERARTEAASWPNRRFQAASDRETGARVGHWTLPAPREVLLPGDRHDFTT